MKDIDFLILYEHKNREFESIALLKHELVKRGYTVEFFAFSEIHNRKKKKRLFGNVSIAVMPSLYHDEEILEFVYGVAGRVKNIVNLRWEQLFPHITEKNLDYYVYPKENAKNAYHCCWGKKPYEMLNKTGIDIDKLFITGPIHMDFLRDNFKYLYFSKSELFEVYNIDTNKRCILFTSSFATSSMNKWTLDWLYSQYEGEEKEYMKEYVPREIESRDKIIKWLVQLADTKDCTIIYRPHPAEVSTTLIEELNNKRNIRVISDCNVKQWIITCDQVYTWNSTSITEAYVAGVPCAVLRPIELDRNDEYSIYEDMPFITSFQQFSSCYENNCQESSSQFINSNKLYDYLSIDADIPSYIRTADILEQALKDDYYFPWNNFTNETLQEIEKNLFGVHPEDFMSKIIIGPFYSFNFSRKIVSRLFGRLTDIYIKIKSSKKPPITDGEFKLLEDRIAKVLSSNI